MRPSPRIEKQARATDRLSKAFALAAKHRPSAPPMPPVGCSLSVLLSSPYRECSSIEEVNAVRGRLTVDEFRAMRSDDEPAAAAAFASFSSSFDDEPARRPSVEPETDAFRAEVRAVLVKLGLDPALADCSTETQLRDMRGR